jgi:hypothetical protein
VVVGGVVFLELHRVGLVARLNVVSIECYKELLNFLLVLVSGQNGLILLSLLLVSLNLDASLGHEGLQGYFLGNLDHLSAVSHLGKVEHGGVDVGCRLDQLEVDRVLEVQLERGGFSLESAPEKLAGFLDNVVGREGSQELLDLIVEDILEDVNSQLDALLIAFLLIRKVKLVNIVELHPESGGVLPVLFFEGSQKLISVAEEVDKVGRRFRESSFEVVPGPLDGVLDLVREVLECAQRNTLFRRVVDVGVANRLVRDDDLRMTLGSEGAGLEKRLFEPDALTIDVLSGLDIVDSVDHKVQICPEVISEDIIVLRTDPCFQRLKSDIFVHSLSDCASSLTFIFADMLPPEQKLPVEVADFDVVVVSHCHLATLGGETHQSEHLDELTAQGASTDHKGTRI